MADLVIRWTSLTQKGRAPLVSAEASEAKGGGSVNIQVVQEGHTTGTGKLGMVFVGFFLSPPKKLDGKGIQNKDRLTLNKKGVKRSSK